MTDVRTARPVAWAFIGALTWAIACGDDASTGATISANGQDGGSDASSAGALGLGSGGTGARVRDASLSPWMDATAVVDGRAREAGARDDGVGKGGRTGMDAGADVGAGGLGPCGSFNAGGQRCADSSAPLGGDLHVRVAHMSPSLPALRVCARAAGSRDAWQDLTLDPNPPPPDVPHVDGAAIVSTCGNGVLDPGEICDGNDLGGKTCASLTMGSSALGAVRCDSSCLFDLSDCRSAGTGGAPGGTGGAPFGAGGAPSVPDAGRGGTDAGALPASGGAPTADCGVNATPPRIATIVDGLDYTEVSTYLPVVGAAQDVKLVGASGTCDAPALLTTTLRLRASYSTWLVTGRPDPDGNPSTSDSTLRVLSLQDAVGVGIQLGDRGFRLVQAVEGAPSLDGRVTGQLAFPLATFERGIADTSVLPPATTSSAGSQGFHASTVPGYVEEFVGLQLGPFTLNLGLTESFTSVSRGGWDWPASGFDLTTTVFVHGSWGSDLDVLRCSDSLKTTSSGLSTCSPLPRNCNLPGALDLSIPVINLSPDGGPLDVCRRPTPGAGWDDSQKAPLSIGYGQSVTTRGPAFVFPTIRLVAAGVPCAGPAVAERMPTQANAPLVLVGLSTPQPGQPPLQLVESSAHFLLQTGNPSSGMNVLHGAVGLAAVDMARVASGVMAQPSWPTVSFGRVEAQLFPALSDLVLGIAPFGDPHPAHVATVGVPTLGSHYYGAFLMGVEGSQTEPLSILLCDQTAPFPTGSLPCRTLSLSP